MILRLDCFRNNIMNPCILHVICLKLISQCAILFFVSPRPILISFMKHRYYLKSQHREETISLFLIEAKHIGCFPSSRGPLGELESWTMCQYSGLACLTANIFDNLITIIMTFVINSTTSEHLLFAPGP